MPSIAKDSEAESTNKSNRKHNYSKWLVLPLLVAVFLLLFSANVQGEEAAEATVSPRQAQLESIYKHTVNAQYRTEVWNHKLSTHDKYGHAQLPKTDSLFQAQKRLKVWDSKAAAAKERYLLSAKQAAANKDFHKALKLASERYGVSYSWLHSCAHSEGHIHGYRYDGRIPQKHLGIDPFVMNKGGSGAGGWMQFMSGTFYNPHYEVARKELPSKYRKWNSRLGQAWVAAYIFSIEGSKQWTGKGC